MSKLKWFCTVMAALCAILTIAFAFNDVKAITVFTMGCNTLTFTVLAWTSWRYDAR